MLLKQIHQYELINYKDYKNVVVIDWIEKDIGIQIGEALHMFFGSYT